MNVSRVSRFGGDKIKHETGQARSLVAVHVCDDLRPMFLWAFLFSFSFCYFFAGFIRVYFAYYRPAKKFSIACRGQVTRCTHEFSSTPWPAWLVPTYTIRVCVANGVPCSVLAQWRSHRFIRAIDKGEAASSPERFCTRVDVHVGLQLPHHRSEPNRSLAKERGCLVSLGSRLAGEPSLLQL